MKRLEKQMLLTRKAVDELSEWIQKWLQETKLASKDILRIRLSMEEILLHICDHFGEKTDIHLILGKRFGRPVLRLNYKGESYNPIPQDDQPEDGWSQMLFSRLGLLPAWSYNNGINEIEMQGPSRALRSETLLAGAAVLAVGLGLAGGLFPPAFRQAATDYVLLPLSGAFMSLMHTFVGILVFLSVLFGVTSVSGMSDFSRMGKLIISRLLFFTFLGAGVSIFLLIPFFPFGNGALTGDGLPIDTMVSMVFSMFPSDPITPFAERNMLQIVFMAVLTGCAMLVLEAQVEGFRSLLQQAYMVVMQLVEGICRFLPLYIFTSLVEVLWEEGTGLFFQLWKPIVIYLLIVLLFLAVKTAMCCLRLSIKPGPVISAIKKPVLIGLTTASSSSSFEAMLEANEQNLGISRQLSRFGTPMGILLSDSTTSLLLMTVLFYLASYYRVAVDPVWLIIAWFMCSVLSMTIPPVSGGMLAVIGILMQQLGVPMEGLAVAGLLAIFLDFLSTAGRIYIIHIELLLQGFYLGMWNRDKS